MAKPSIPKGTRDFSPVEVSKRNYIISIMRHHFEKYGYQPIETPSFENSDTLMGKYGEEGDRLIFKILNSGDYLNALEVSSRDSSIKDLEKILKIDNEILDVVISTLKQTLINQNLPKDIINQFKSEYSNSDIILLEKFLFYKSKKNKRSKIELLKYLNNISSKILKGNIKKSFKQSRLSNFSASPALATKISEKALRYDLTVPFARYVVQHQSDIEFPFKRYQIQPVWRADRPQKGRFREFYQCDADVVGSKSLWQEVELVQLYDGIFAELGLEGVTIKINNRKILTGIAEVIGASDKLIDFTVALDKLDKIGEDGVKKEMLEKGISESAIQKVQPLFQFTGSIDEKIAKLSTLLASSKEGMKGVEELQFICENVTQLGLQKAILDLDVTLARGLNYYTGAIFEVAAPKGVAMGSIGGGGRYDDLTGIFGLPNTSGVGISFGLDRIYLVLDELNLFPETVITSTKVLFLNLGASQELDAMKAIQQLRANNIKSEMYPDAVKIDKQFKHAERRGIPFVVKEIKDGAFTVKNIISGEQSQMNFEQLLSALQ